MQSIGIVLYPGFQLLDLSPSTVFEFANLCLPEPRYNIRMLSEHGGPVLSSAGFSLDSEPFDDEPIDTVLVPGDNRGTTQSSGLITFLQRAAEASRRVASACTGAFVLGQAGLLDGRRVTTHWTYSLKLQNLYPASKMEQDRIFIVDGPIWTSAGGTAALDLALAMVERDCGADIALAVSKKLVIYHRRGGGQPQFSALLEMEPKSDRIQMALTWARDHLQADLSVEQLAQVASLSTRQFSRAFREETGESPARAVERLRLEAAKLMMEEGRHPIETIANQTGFGDRERMRRAFLRTYGRSPQAMRRDTRTQADAPV